MPDRPVAWISAQNKIESIVINGASEIIFRVTWVAVTEGPVNYFYLFFFFIVSDYLETISQYQDCRQSIYNDFKFIKLRFIIFASLRWRC